MKLIFLGTNGWFDTGTGNTPCVLIETKSEYLILDAGLGLHKIDRYITGKKPIYLFLSHFHFDHIYGIHIFNKFDFPQGMHIYGPKGVKKYIGGLLRSPFTMPAGRLRTKVMLHDLSEQKKPPIALEFRELAHPSLCYGYRFTLEKKIVTYCTDTAMSPNVVTLARNADFFISECSFKSGQQSRKWSHLNPELAASAAKEANAKRLALTHFDAALYTTRNDRRAAERAAQKIFKNTFAAVDGMVISL